ncbi:MAG TPA: alpha-galactosidase, partial [Lachnospiraceae bacterium]|nr:alpha-galactosidase [Lachnospiraceae bacterium]
DEYRLHFNLWALLGSPLMIGCDIRNMSESTRAILTNKDVIAINQDPDYNQAYTAEQYKGQWPEASDFPIYVKLLANG